MQAHGPQNLQRKLILMSPMLINADSTAPPPVPEYLVKL
jgi:hypothetical protein